MKTKAKRSKTYVGNNSATYIDPAGEYQIRPVGDVFRVSPRTEKCGLVLGRVVKDTAGHWNYVGDAEAPVVRSIEAWLATPQGAAEIEGTVRQMGNAVHDPAHVSLIRTAKAEMRDAMDRDERAMNRMMRDADNDGACPPGRDYENEARQKYDELCRRYPEAFAVMQQQDKARSDEAVARFHQYD